ncbi:phospholipase D [Suillus clintonianus]|uniref:phospholipase D n=1 Tax=Suillus clintonianus TaxID=1904413 RepID=UPI001B87E1E8|nr:phospholipase D [Suillus clintonianus]KAG2151353.1 phospholipase D [Suillus clintonianus]
MGFADLVNAAITASHEQDAEGNSANSSGHGKHDDTGNVDSRTSIDQHMSRVESPAPISPPSSPLRTPRTALPDTPSNRTGPPRSLSFSFSHPSSSSIPRQMFVNGQQEYTDAFENDLGDHGRTSFQHNSSSSSFRGAFELSPSLGKATVDKKGKARESKLFDRSHDSPIEEKPNSIFPEPSNTIIEEEEEKVERKPMSRHQTIGPTRKPTDPPPRDLQRSQSHPPRVETKKPGTSAKWSKLRGLLPSVIRTGQSVGPAPHSVVTSHEVNITDELITGGLSTLMLHLWFEHDEKGHRRIPVLLHRLRIRISDSLHPMQAHKAVFRIECEYANGAVRWVVYRQLRDFISMHTHYAVANAFSSQKDALPEFPRTSLPYFKFLKKESGGRHVKQTDFARLQREALEDYLIKLIRAVMFHPTSNRIAGFLEISALFITLAQSGGAQYKAGYLRISTEGNGPEFGRKSARWRERKEARWCAVRESYIVVVEDPGEIVIWDVFLFDTDFKIIRPTRYYRKGLHLLRPEPEDREFLIGVNETQAQAQTQSQTQTQTQTQYPQAEVDCLSAIDSIKSRLSRALRFANRSSPNIAANTGSEVQGNGDVATGVGHTSTDTISSGSSVSSRPATPMLDPSTHVNPLKGSSAVEGRETQAETNEQEKRKRKKRSDDVSKHTFYVENSQMRLKLFARNERQMLQWITALEKAAATTPFVAKNRFDSFAPVRLNVAAQWLVDGRDYMWNLSRAILMAQETIYIHDWWLSPELQLRRPNKLKYRLDHLLERKAKEGVKIHIILYQEVSNRTTPTDSNYAKQRLVSLHPNIMVQRSPSHFQTGTFYWAHHEKLCVIDETIAFMGGIDLCFGRWDTPQHVIVDDPELSAEKIEIWPGKDYSNPRVLDFHALNKPLEDMYDRTKVPRMPWHDVGMQVVGQPARDMARHFVERWNYLLRLKNHSRNMPFLLPPPEYKPGELAAMGLTGTCEMQICRSAGPWSLGTPNRTEHSIQNAYLKAIELSEHFVYIENQFFITSTVVNDVKIENRIGDALVDRITRAHRERTPWKCCIVIPLLPGFPLPIDHSDASAIRIIVECQNRTICRGPNSIFARLRKEGIDPDDYISVFSLRNWAKMRNGVLATEIVYIHGKVCIVDDRLAIIGSANINERSQRGERDSEVAAVIRDTDLIDGTMAGNPFKVGRFAHTLRMRLMREHLGVDVDAMTEHDPMPHEDTKPDQEQEVWDPELEQEHGDRDVTQVKHASMRNMLHTAGDGIKHGGDAIASSTSRHLKKPTGKAEPHEPSNPEQDGSLEEERLTHSREGTKAPGFSSTMVPTVEETVVQERLPPASQAENPPLKDKIEHRLGENSDPVEKRTADGEANGAPALASRNPQTYNEPLHVESGVNDPDELEKTAPGTRALPRKHLASKASNKTWVVPTPAPHVDPEGFEDPISDAFWKNVWKACAVHNTEIYRKVFHAVPDDLITTWKQYKEFVSHHERYSKPATGSHSCDPASRVPSETAHEDGPYQKGGLANAAEESRETFHTNDGSDGAPRGSHPLDKDIRGRKPVNGVEPFTKQERDEMEELLKDVRGHLVVYPTRFLEVEDNAGNFVFNADRMLPLQIYD